MKWTVVALLIAAVLLYLTTGAFLFRYLERRTSEGPKSVGKLSTVNISRRFLGDHPAVTLSEDELSQLLDDVISAYSNGSVGMQNDTEEGSRWNIADSFFYVCTVITTIGYGHIAPVTVNGRVTTIFYGIIGIPLCFVMLAGLGGKLDGLVKTLASRLTCQIADSVTTRKVVRISMVFAIGWTLFIILPSVVFLYVEGWTYVDSLYFCFITLSTVGFGDLIPDGGNQGLIGGYRAIVMVWVYIGLAWLSTLITTISDVIQTSFTEGEAKVHDKITSAIGNVLHRGRPLSVNAENTCETKQSPPRGLNVSGDVDSEITQQSDDNQTVTEVIVAGNLA